MKVAYVVVVVITVIINAYAGISDLIPTKSVLANSGQVHVPRSWLPTLGMLKLAGAVGLVAGLFGVPAIGVAAATGLVLFFIGAVITHLRAAVLYNIAFPGGYLLMSAASLALLAVH
jgi:hypothetical protein